MANLEPLAFGRIVVLFGIQILLTAVSRHRGWNTLRSSAAWAVTHTGMAEVEGTARPLGETLDPPTGKGGECRGRRHEKYDPDLTNEQADSWGTVATESDRVPFVLSDSGDEAESRLPKSGITAAVGAVIVLGLGGVFVMIGLGR